MPTSSLTWSILLTMTFTEPFPSSRSKEKISSKVSVFFSRPIIRLIVDQNDKLAAFGLCFPSISKAVQKSGGHLTLPTLFKILKAKKDPEIIDLGLIGVTEKYRNSGVSWAIFLEIMKMLKSGKVQYCETNLNLEDNKAIQNNWERFHNELHKRRRSFVKKI